jgi:hypothetical protein
MPPVAVPNLGHWAQPAPRGRRRILLGLAAALTAIVVAAVAFLFDSWSQSSPPTQPAATTSPLAPAPVGTTTPPRSPVITTNLINPPGNEHHGDEGDGDHGDGG